MARVSQEHLDARRRQILDAARRCFARNGFHATSMQDMLSEAGLSAGAVYRYFKGKDELIAAIVGEVLEYALATYEDAAQEDPPPTPDVLIPRIVTRMQRLRPETENGQWLFPRLMLQVWTETLRDRELAAIIEPAVARIRAAWNTIGANYKAAGLMDEAADTDAMARTLLALVQGYASQHAMFGGVPEATLRDGLRALMSIRPAEPPPAGTDRPAPRTTHPGSRIV
ncbi:TetR/AcrR family transcriptional regulator [Streptomyces sp. NPDC004610]|uniref:TetR/AcrR family transcriptional regulator n=1 Tax=unclassified Streptomyces TaxID=2593676 RepID=UPI00339DD950